MNTFAMNNMIGRALRLVALVAFFFGANAALAASAKLSPDMLNLSTGQSGSSVLSGDDGRGTKNFEWSYPSGLSVSKGSSSNLSKFSIDTAKRLIKVTTAAKGNFSAGIKLSSSSAGTYVVKNTKADIGLNPKDITVVVVGSGGGGGGGGGGMGGGAGNAIPVLNAADGITLGVVSVNKAMSDGKNVTFWVYCQMGMGGGGMGGCPITGPVLELGAGRQANVTLNMMMAPQESPPYHGHTIHWHGLDVSQSEDGVPETGAAVLGDNYKFTVDGRYVGSHMYHCHVHTVKHLEMGMYAPFIVRAVDGNGNFVNTINQGGPSYDYEWNVMFASVDPAYHTATGDSTVFADYNPKYFLVNGNEGRSRSAPAEVFTAAPGAKVAMRLMGIHSVNATFEIKDASGAAKSFTVHNRDGFKLPSTQTVSKLDISPGQTADILVTLPSGSGSWYPQFTFKNLRDGTSFSNGVAYAQLSY